MGIAGSDLGRPALSGLSSLTTWINGVEETIATAKSCGDIKAQAMASERPTTTRATTSDSSTINAVERATRQKEGMIESLVLQHEIAMLMHEAFERSKAIHNAVQKLYIHCAELVQQRQASMPEQALTAPAADSKEAHTDIQQAPNVSHTDEVATTDDSSAVQCGEGTCDAGGDAAPARFGAGEATQYTASDFHPCKSDIVMMPDNLRLYPVERSSRGTSSNDLGVPLEGSTADEWPRWYGTEMADLHGSNGTTVRLNLSIILRHSTSMMRINEGAVRGLIAQRTTGPRP